MSVYQINHPIVAPTVQTKKKMTAHKKNAVLPKLNNVRTFGSKYVSKALDFDHDLHLDAPHPRKVSRLDAKLKQDSDRLLQKLKRHQMRIRRMKRNAYFRRMKRRMDRKEKENEEDDSHEEKYEEKEHTREK